jgi:hypothetical protein
LIGVDHASIAKKLAPSSFKIFASAFFPPNAIGNI